MANRAAAGGAGSGIRLDAVTRDVQLPPAFTLVALDEVDSTNDEARRLAEGGAEEGTLVWALSQRKGRGRRGRDWVSPEGNLYLSLLLRPDCSPREAAQLSFVAAMALTGALNILVAPHSRLDFKWPNDVLLNESKVAGILLEASTTGPDSLDWLIIGMGVNVASAPDGTSYPATALRAEGSGEVTPGEVLEGFARHFQTRVNAWVDGGFAPIREEVMRYAKGIGETITVKLDDETIDGIFADIDETGALIVELVDGSLRTIHTGDVFFGNAT
jgi:BirA family biotin operon repressor/biotin-[acetyl-CoA-carboxylase] ligase